jgi:Mrp family chromosome partitioning ATPase
LENLTAYKLDAPRGGTQHALVTITSKIDDVFVVYQVQHLSADQAAQAKQSLSQLLQLAIRMNQKDFKRNSPWDDTMSPVQAKRCRVLGRSPTAPPIEENTA